MILQFIHHLISWIGAHPHLAGLIVALISFSESLAFVGLVVPGSTLMIGAGMLVGAGALAFWPTLVWAVGGAVAGDGVSFWLGHHYREGLNRWLRRRPELKERGESFFRRHGGMSVILARFVGPVRPIVPVVAGMLGLSPVRFYFYNALSALAWAPAHLVPGMVFGASLTLAGLVAGRMALLFGALIVAVWIIVWLARWLYGWLPSRMARWVAGLSAWAQRHRRAGWLVTELLDPARPASRALLAWLVVLVAGSWLFLGVLEDVLTGDPLVYAGQSLYHLLQQVRTPPADRVMVVLTELGDAAVTLPVMTVVLAWLLWRRAWRDALYWLAAVGFGAVAVVIIKALLHMPRPIELYSGVEAYSFPSSHASMNTVIYGFLAVLVARGLDARRRWIPYALATLLVGGISFSRLYLGAHWLADVTAGVALGTAWVAVLAIARARHKPAGLPVGGLLPIVLLVFLGAGGWHVHQRLTPDLARYAVRHAIMPMEATAWWREDWRRLPVYRLDLHGEREQPLNLQWAGDINFLKNYLAARGWRDPPLLTPRTALRWLLPSPALVQLPVLPQLHAGEYESLLLVRHEEAQGNKTRQLVLRLWPTDVRLRPGGTPLWVGTAGELRLLRLPLISFPRSAGGYDAALADLRAALHGLPHETVKRAVPQEEERIRWDGELLLARRPAE